MEPLRLKRLQVARRIGGGAHEGRLIAGSLTIPCALGRAGLTRAKREGDGATPCGDFKLLYLLARPGQISAAGIALPLRRLRRGDLWCDDATSFLYNRPLRAPARARFEELCRADRLYDAIGVLDYNIVPPIRGRGSAIFFHIATADLQPTAGCVALRARDMARLLPRLARRVTLSIR